MGKVYNLENEILEKLINGGSLERDNGLIQRPAGISEEGFKGSLYFHAIPMMNKEIENAYDKSRLGTYAFTKETVNIIINRYSDIIRSLFFNYCYYRLDLSTVTDALRSRVDKRFLDAMEEEQ